MVPTSASFCIGVSEPDSYLMAVDLVSYLLSKLHAWSSHVIIFPMEDPFQQPHSRI